MKNLFSTAAGKMKAIAETQLLNLLSSNTSLFLFLAIVMSTLLFASCDKQDLKVSPQNIQPMRDIDTDAPNKPTLFKGRLNNQTLWELEQAKAATAKYQNISNAFADQYDSINVVIPNMGYHFLKASLVDSVFDFRRPELLVYNKDGHGRFRLVALEYAVPIALSPNAAPEGFTGNEDEWEQNIEFGLWTLHAWVWEFNPEGVFHHTNPRVIVH